MNDARRSESPMKSAQEQVTLRPLALTDLHRVFKWHNDPELYTTLAGHFRNVKLDTEKEWLFKRIDAKDELNLAICLAGSDEHIGNIYLRNIEWVDRNAELHIFIAAPEHRGKGYGAAAVKQLLKRAFGDLGLVRVYLHVLASNGAAVATYEKCGFVVEGRLRRHVLKKDRFEDVLIMGICRE